MKNIFSSLKWILILCAATSFTLLGCNKDNGDDGQGEGDTVAPTLSLNSPTEGQTFMNGDTILITAMATDETAMHEYVWTIKDGGGLTVHEATVSVHNETEHDIEEMYEVSGVTSADTWMVTIHVEDHGENSDEKSVTVNVNP